jgi:hypothetical protein
LGSSKKKGRNALVKQEWIERRAPGIALTRGQVVNELLKHMPQGKAEYRSRLEKALEAPCAGRKGKIRPERLAALMDEIIAAGVLTELPRGRLSWNLLKRPIK